MRNWKTFVWTPVAATQHPPPLEDIPHFYEPMFLWHYQNCNPSNWSYEGVIGQGNHSTLAFRNSTTIEDFLNSSYNYTTRNQYLGNTGGGEEVPFPKCSKPHKCPYAYREHLFLPVDLKKFVVTRTREKGQYRFMSPTGKCRCQRIEINLHHEMNVCNEWLLWWMANFRRWTKDVKSHRYFP